MNPTKPSPKEVKFGIEVYDMMQDLLWKKIEHLWRRTKMAPPTRKKREEEVVMHGGSHVWITHGSSNNITCMTHTMHMKRMMKCNTKMRP